MEVACVHVDTYPTCHVAVRTPHGVFTIRAGIVPHLPVPLLVGRDCPIFHRLWDPTRELRSRRGPPRREARGVRQAYGATRPPSSPGELTAEDEGSEGNGPSPPGTPGHTGRGPVRSETPEPTPDTPESLTASEQPDPPEDPESSPLTEFSDFLPEGGEGSSRPGQFATAQLQDEALKHAWSHVLVHDGQAQDSRHGYCTLGEAFNRLDFSSAIQDLRRFNYVAKLFQLIAKSQLTSLSGGAQKNYFNILDKIVCKVLEEHYNPRLIKDLLQDLSCTVHALTKGVGKCVLVGSINVWLLRLDTIHHWQLQLNNLHIPKQMSNGTKFCDLPLDTHNTILYKFSDASDIINLGQAIPTLHMLSEHRNLWRKLCLFHFSERQFSMNMVLNESGSVDWKGLYFSLQRHNPQREHYGDTLHFCRHCSILFWKDCGHPCTAADPDRTLVPVSPQHFIDLFKF